MLERVACIRMREESAGGCKHLEEHVYSGSLWKKMYRVVGVYVLFVIIINEVHSGAMVVTKDVSGRSNCYVSVNNLVWCLF